jgi:uncharacterized protein YciI
MRTLFAVVRTKGPAWDHSKPLRAQDGWAEHADFMDGLAACGFVILGGPLGGSDDVLLAISAASEEEVSATLARDPWSQTEMLTTSSVRPWNILLEAKPR